MARPRKPAEQESLFDAPQGEALTDTGVLYRDDNLSVLKELPPESVDLVYLDPPFFSNKVYEVIWGDEAEVRSFEDRWAGGIQHYIEWMHERVKELHRVLKPSGSLYLHCDPHASHYLKIMLDEIFGGSNYRNEIIWRRTGSHSPRKSFGPIHDSVHFYSKTKDYKFNLLTRPYTKQHVAKRYKRDATGKLKFMSGGNVLTGAGSGGGESSMPWKGFDPAAKQRHWAIPGFLTEVMPPEFKDLGVLGKLDALYKEGLIEIKEGNAWPTPVRYLKPEHGNPMGDIWAYLPGTQGVLATTAEGVDEDVAWLGPTDPERWGYPTQKPEGLLSRIIRASSDPGDVVLDPFCGCGTTVAVAHLLSREWVGIDISPTAVQIMQRRLMKQGFQPKIYNPVDSIEELMKLKPFEFQNWIVYAVHGQHSQRLVKDMGIDGFWYLTKDPIQVKQSEKVGRVEVDKFQTAMRRVKHTTGYIIGFSFTKDAFEEVARARKEEGLEIHLVKVAEILLEMKRPYGKIGPQPATVEEFPKPELRKRKDLPTVQELIESEENGDEAVGE